MGIRVGSARIGENGKATGGKDGDQTGGEVSMQDFYISSKGWYIMRPKKSSIAEKIAEAMITACNNNNIGYNQNERLDVVKNGVNSKIKINSDCSSLVRACCMYAGFDPGNFTTANEVTALKNTGLFEDKVKFASLTKTPIFNGDILVTCTKGHTVIVCSGNPRPASMNISGSNYYPKYTGTSSSITVGLQSVGELDTSMAHRQKIASANGVKNYSGTAAQNTNLLKLLKNGKLIKA